MTSGSKTDEKLPVVHIKVREFRRARSAIRAGCLLVHDIMLFRPRCCHLPLLPLPHQMYVLCLRASCRRALRQMTHLSLTAIFLKFPVTII